jgi:hypothetical protein
MLSIDRCREILGAAATGMSDAQIDRLRRELYWLADIAVSMFLESRQPPARSASTEERSA